MWAPPTPAYTEGTGTYPPLLPPPPPPQPLQDYRLSSSPHQFHAQSTTAPQLHTRPHGSRVRGRGGSRPQNPLQNQGTKMPAGLAGPWQAGLQQQQDKEKSTTVQSPKPSSVQQPVASTVLATPLQHEPETTPVTKIETKPKVILAGGGERTLETKGTIDIASVKIKLLEGLMNVKADTYPKELLAKMSPLRCDLCVAKMNSTLQAKMHYNGKQHEKKVRMFMVNWSQATGEPLPKKAKLEEPEAVSPQEGQAEEVSPSTPSVPESKVQSLYCKCCDLSFTSALHAEQHYTGRNHQRVLQGQTPLKTGYFNPNTGKWQRKPPEDPTGRFGVGISFLTDEAKRMAERIADEERKGRFYCNLCNVGATSQEQLDMHYHGAKHRKMVANKLLTEEAKNNAIEAPVPDDTLLKSVSKDAGSSSSNSSKTSKDLSFFRTPSGKFYCQPCNITLNSESQFISHTESKKHKVKLASQKPAMTLTGPKAEQWGDKSSALWAS